MSAKAGKPPKPRGKLWPYKGGMYFMRDLARLSPVSENIIRERINRGWDVECAVDTPSVNPGPAIAARFKLCSDGGQPPEGWNAADAERYAAAVNIFHAVIAGAPAQFNFTALTPDHYRFRTEHILFHVDFEQNRAALTACYPKKHIRSSLLRIYAVDGEKIKEVTNNNG